MDREGVDEQILKVIQGHPGVKSASPILKLEGEIQTGPLAGRSLLIWGVDLLEQVKGWQEGGGSEGIPEETWEQFFCPHNNFSRRRPSESFWFGPGSRSLGKGPRGRA